MACLHDPIHRGLSGWFEVWGSKLGVLGWGLGFRVWGLGFGVWGLGLGFRVRGVGIYGTPQNLHLRASDISWV